MSQQTELEEVKYTPPPKRKWWDMEHLLLKCSIVLLFVMNTAVHDLQQQGFQLETFQHIIGIATLVWVVAFFKTPNKNYLRGLVDTIILYFILNLICVPSVILYNLLMYWQR